MNELLFLGGSIVDFFDNFRLLFDDPAAPNSGLFAFAREIAGHEAFLLLTGVLFMITVGIKVLNAYLNPSQAVYSQILIRPILIMACIPLYNHLVWTLIHTPVSGVFLTINEAINSLAGVTVNPDGIQSTICRPDFYDSTASAPAPPPLAPGLTAAEVAARTAARDASTATVELVAKTSSFVDSVRFFFENPWMEIFHFLFCIASMVSVVYVLFRMVITISIMHVMGPFAITFSLIPGNEGNLSKWFFGYLSVTLWAPLILLFLGIAESLKGIAYADINNALLIIVVDVGVVLSLFKIPALAGYLVGGQNAAEGSSGRSTRQFFSKALTGKFNRKKS